MQSNANSQVVVADGKSDGVAGVKAIKTSSKAKEAMEIIVKILKMSFELDKKRQTLVDPTRIKEAKEDESKGFISIRVLHRYLPSYVELKNFFKYYMRRPETIQLPISQM